MKTESRYLIKVYLINGDIVWFGMNSAPTDKEKGLYNPYGTELFDFAKEFGFGDEESAYEHPISIYGMFGDSVDKVRITMLEVW